MMTLSGLRLLTVLQQNSLSVNISSLDSCEYRGVICHDVKIRAPPAYSFSMYFSSVSKSIWPNLSKG